MAVNPTIWWVRLHSKVASLTASLLIGRSRHTFFRNAANKNGEIYDVHIYLSQLFSLFVKTIQIWLNCYESSANCKGFLSACHSLPFLAVPRHSSIKKPGAWTGHRLRGIEPHTRQTSEILAIYSLHISLLISYEKLIVFMELIVFMVFYHVFWKLRENLKSVTYVNL